VTMTTSSTASSSRRKSMVDGALTRVSVVRVGLGVGGSSVTSGSCARPSHSCDGWVCDLGVVDTSSIFVLISGSGSFVEVFPTFVLVSRMHLTQQYRGNGHFLGPTSSS
jgi:hypothetical protein